MALPSLIEELLSLSTGPETAEPGTLLFRVGVEYYYPIVPPFTVTVFSQSVTRAALAGQRGFGTQNIYATPEVYIFFGATFGKLEPGAFTMRATIGGNVAIDGRLDGMGLEHGIDYLFFSTASQGLVAELTNVTNKNQYFQMISHYLIVPTKENWTIVRNYLKAKELSVTLPGDTPGEPNRGGRR